MLFAWFGILTQNSLFLKKKKVLSYVSLITCRQSHPINLIFTTVMWRVDL